MFLFYVNWYDNDIILIKTEIRPYFKKTTHRSLLEALTEMQSGMILFRRRIQLRLTEFDVLPS